MGTIKTFIAVDIAPVITSAAKKQIRALERIIEGYRWVDTANMHLTLKFLGNVLDREIPELCKVVEGALAEHPILDIDFRGLGTFPSIDRPRTLWMGIEDIDGAFAAMQRSLDVALSEKLGFQPEKRDFKAHLTLGRAVEQARSDSALSDYLAANADTDYGSMEVDQVIVYSSFPERGKPTYTAMDTIDLGT